MDNDDKKRAVYESTVLEDIHQLMSSSRFTAKCHYNRVEEMRSNEDICKLIALGTGVSGIIVPAIQNFPRARVWAPLVFGVTFYCADRLGKHFGDEKDRSFRGASKWMKLYTNSNAAKSTILANYVSAGLEVTDLEMMKKTLFDLKISLDNDPDSPTYGYDFDAVNKGFNDEEVQWLESSMENIARYKRMINSTVPPSIAAEKTLSKIRGQKV